MVRITAGFVILAGLLLGPVDSAAADDSAAESKQVKLQCAQSYEKAQRHRKSGRWSEAREQALACAQEACPGVLSSDCANWVDEIDAQMPTHVFLLEDQSGGAIAGATVSIDGGTFEEVSGQPTSFDPGKHTALFRTPAGDEVSVSFQSTSGQKNVLVRGEFVPERQAEQATSGSSVPTGTWVLSSVSVVSLGVFGALAISGSTQESRLRDECSEVRCSADRGEAIKSTYLGADIALGVGVVSLGAGLAWWALAPRRAGKPEVSVGLTGPRGSTGLTLRSTF